MVLPKVVSLGLPATYIGRILVRALYAGQEVPGLFALCAPLGLWRASGRLYT